MYQKDPDEDEEEEGGKADDWEAKVRSFWLFKTEKSAMI